jgi:hypothetical protein
MIRLSDGRRATAKVGLPLGSPENRLSIELTARHAVRPPPDDTVLTAIQMIRHLEEVPDVSELLTHFN